MKHPIPTVLAVAALAFGAMNVASADEAETDMVMKALVEAGVDEPMVNVSVDGGVATLSGTVEDDIAKERVVEAVRQTPGVTEVRDNIETST